MEDKTASTEKNGKVTKVTQNMDKPSAELWKGLKSNKLVMAGFMELILYFVMAGVGWLGTSG